MNQDDDEETGHLVIDESGFYEVSCDKCGSCCMYAKGTEPKECFGCACKRLEEMEVNCVCGWKGKYFDQKISMENLTQRYCPDCDRENVYQDSDGKIKNAQAKTPAD